MELKGAPRKEAGGPEPTESGDREFGKGKGGELEPRHELERSVNRGRKLNVLFLCTGNSCRSQMAEGWARSLRGDLIEPFSAGIEAHGLNGTAVRVMAEAGVDISSQRSKVLDTLAHVEFDQVITVCDSASERCPVFRGKARVMHVGFDDPPALGRHARSPEEALGHYRRVRDEIRAFVETLPESLEQQHG